MEVVTIWELIKKSVLLVKSLGTLTKTTGKAVVDEGGFENLLECGVHVHVSSSRSGTGNIISVTKIQV